MDTVRRGRSPGVSHGVRGGGAMGMTLRCCAHPGCPVLVPSGRCLMHGGERKPWAKSHDAPPRMTGRKLQARRRSWFRRYPLCVSCEAQGETAIATILDHVIPLAEGGADDERNLQGLCRPCHNHKTDAEKKRGIIRANATW